MDSIEPNWESLLLFTAVWAVSCVGAIYLSGSLPIGAAPESVRRGTGPLLVVVNAALLAVLIVATLIFALAELRLTSLVVAGGMVFLFSPFVVQDLPAGLKDNKRGLMLLLGLTLSALTALYLAGAIPSVREFILT